MGKKASFFVGMLTAIVGLSLIVFLIINYLGI